MAYKEYHIDGNYGLYADYYHTVGNASHTNPFRKSHRDTMAPAALTKFNELDAFGVLATDANQNKFIPLTAHLIVPDREEGAPFPLAVFIHGNASTFSTSGGRTREVKSYRGYRYLQQYLGDHGIASISVNVNVAGFLDNRTSDGDEIERLETALLALVFLHQLLQAPVTGNQPILLKKDDDSLLPLHEALALEGPFSTGSPEGRLHRLKAEIQGKISFAKMGFMGHSRGGQSVNMIQPFFSPRMGPAPTNFDTPIASVVIPTDNPFIKNQNGFRGPYNSNTLGTYHSSIVLNFHLYHYMINLVDMMGGIQMSGIKSIVALEPSGNKAYLNSADTFYLAISGSHDEDVGESSFNGYENSNTPKAMIFSHGASHGRFNQVWRRLNYVRRKINNQILCQSPIRMLSNRGHENLLKATAGNVFIATLRDEHHRLAFFTGELRATSLRQDVSRAWKFPFPFSTPPKLLDNSAIRVFNTSTGVAVTPADVDLGSRWFVLGESDAVVAPQDEAADPDDIHFYSNKVKLKAYIKPFNETMVIKIPITDADRLITQTHFSFRYSKEYNAQSRTARRNVDLRNYSLTLKSPSATIGATVLGADVPSLHHKAYPAFDYHTVEYQGCLDDTAIVLQTAEIPLSQFFASGEQPVSDLSQVRTIEISLNPSTGSGNETFFFNDFILTQRTVPASPSGFALP